MHFVTESTLKAFAISYENMRAQEKERVTVVDKEVRAAATKKYVVCNRDKPSWY